MGADMLQMFFNINSYNVEPNCPRMNMSTFFFVTGYLNVLVNSQWRSRWCLIKNGKLWLYQDKGKSKVSQQPVPLEGCMVLPDPSPEHLYSFRIQMDGEELAILEVILISYLVGSLRTITVSNSMAA